MYARYQNVSFIALIRSVRLSISIRYLTFSQLKYYFSFSGIFLDRVLLFNRTLLFSFSRENNAEPHPLGLNLKLRIRLIGSRRAHGRAHQFSEPRCQQAA